MHFHAHTHTHVCTGLKNYVHGLGRKEVKHMHIPRTQSTTNAHFEVSCLRYDRCASYAYLVSDTSASFQISLALQNIATWAQPKQFLEWRWLGTEGWVNGIVDHIHGMAKSCTSRFETVMDIHAVRKFQRLGCNEMVVPVVILRHSPWVDLPCENI
jgi:hypothetical protein